MTQIKFAKSNTLARNSNALAMHRLNNRIYLDFDWTCHADSAPPCFCRRNTARIDHTVGGTAHVKVHLMPATQDGMLFMAHTLVGQSNVQSLHLLCHGTPGTLQMGSEILTREKLAHYRSTLDVLSDAMAADGEWLIYGCDVAHGTKGQSFVDALRLMTGLNVAAASHKVGSTTLGGSWTLDNTNAALRSALSVPQWQGVLTNPPSLDATKSPSLGNLNSYAIVTPPVN